MAQQAPVETTGTYLSSLTKLGGLARLLRYRDCLALLTTRALKVRYRRSVLGFGWTLIYPLASMVVLTVVFSRLFPELHHYSLYVIVGLLAWGFFSLSCVQAMDALISSASVLKKVYVPAAVFPVAAVSANFVNLLLSIMVLPVVMVALGASPGLHSLSLLAALVILFAFTTGLALALASVNLFFNDVRYFFDTLLLVWFYASPIVYPQELIPPQLQVFLWANPFYWLLELLRAPLYAGHPPSALVLGVASGIGLATLAGGWLLFSRLERRFHLYL